MCIVVHEREIILFHPQLFSERKILIMHVESTVDLAIKLISSALTGIYNELPFSCIKSYELL